MENNLTSAEKGKKFLYELRDMIVGAAFPLMLMLVFSVSIILFAFVDDFGIKIAVLIVGELLLAGAYIIFGKFNGTTAAKKQVQNDTKRKLNSTEPKVVFRTGEYAPYKGFLIGLVSCVPYIIVQIIESACPNVFTGFLVRYAFGWAFLPFDMAGLSTWLNLIWVIPLSCIHGVAYIVGGRAEIQRQQKVVEMQSASKSAGKHKDK